MQKLANGFKMLLPWLRLRQFYLRSCNWSKQWSFAIKLVVWTSDLSFCCRHVGANSQRKFQNGFEQKLLRQGLDISRSHFSSISGNLFKLICNIFQYLTLINWQSLINQFGDCMYFAFNRIERHPIQNPIFRTVDHVQIRSSQPMMMMILGFFASRHHNTDDDYKIINNEKKLVSISIEASLTIFLPAPGWYWVMESPHRSAWR